MIFGYTFCDLHLVLSQKLLAVLKDI